jgi:hypothetical protein
MTPGTQVRVLATPLNIWPDLVGKEGTVIRGPGDLLGMVRVDVGDGFVGQSGVAGYPLHPNELELIDA